MTLPRHITARRPKHSNWVVYTNTRSGQMIWSDRVTPEDLEEIARHMRETPEDAEESGPWGVNEDGE